MKQALIEYFSLMLSWRHNKAFAIWYSNSNDDEYDWYKWYDVVELFYNEETDDYEGAIVSDDKYRTRFDFESVDDLLDQLRDIYEDYNKIWIMDY